jgi:hypothetical protein
MPLRSRPPALSSFLFPGGRLAASCEELPSEPWDVLLLPTPDLLIFRRFMLVGHTLAK